ncbi:MAG: ammonia-forming cytochrome c nitrite reductase subunit c552 [Bacteriovoracaceae bacterium]|nr:ammonia-forming cytochrome c nitrite reductase subunit c552 [Bacteriovoracaceae bacterium]
MNKKKLTIIVIIFAIIGIGTGFLATDIAMKKSEERTPYFHVVEIGEFEDDPAVWGKNFPLQYDTYKRTVDMVRTKHGGSESIPRTPSSADPRDVVSQDKLQEDPRLKQMWLGYAFSKDFREERGHAYMLEDQLFTGRQQVPQPGACLNCHASTYVTQVKLGNGDIQKGFELMNQMPYHEAVKGVKHPVSCIDCHNPKDMSLRVTKPAFMEGIKKYKATQNVHNYDVNKMATRQEMRTFVCAQCHVEYFFKGTEKRLTFPWDKGLKADQILEVYRENGHKDWIHAVTRAEVLKAQHPEFEMFSQGVHAKSGVSCVDCHMPYQRVGAMKITDHQARSPLLNINKSCQTCHHSSEVDLLSKVDLIQSRHLEMRDRALNALMQFIDDIKMATDKKISADKIKKAQTLQREAQFLIDFVEAENSAGFHAPQEAARVMMLAMDKIREGQILLR